MKLLYGLAAAGIITAATADSLIAHIAPAAETAATISIQTVQRRAALDHILGTPWADALADVAGNVTQGGDALTVTGTTVTWTDGTYCHRAQLDTVDTPVHIQPC